MNEDFLSEIESKSIPDFSIVSKNLQGELETYKGMKIPYGFTMGIISVVGYISIEDNIDNSCARGIHHIGLIPGEHKIDRNNPTTDFSAEIVKIRFGVDFKNKYFYWRGADRKVKMCGWKPCFYWKWHGKNILFNW